MSKLIDKLIITIRWAFRKFHVILKSQNARDQIT